MSRLSTKTVKCVLAFPLGVSVSYSPLSDSYSPLCVCYSLLSVCASYSDLSVSVSLIPLSVFLIPLSVSLWKGLGDPVLKFRVYATGGI